MTDWKQIEYETLRKEIDQKLRLQNDLLMFAVTTSIAVLTVLLQRTQSSPAWSYSIPLLVLFLFEKRIEYYRDAVAKISAYITIFIEEGDISERDRFPRWETRNSSLQLDRPSFSEEFGIASKFYLRKGNELFILAIVYFLLFVIKVVYEAYTLFQAPKTILTWVNVITLVAALIFSGAIVCGIGALRPSQNPMKDLRSKHLERWKAVRDSESESAKGVKQHVSVNR